MGKQYYTHHGFLRHDYDEHRWDTLKCSRCGDLKSRYVPSCTSYHQEPGEPDANPDVLLCEPCEEEHYAYWKEMWDNYYDAIRF